MKEFKCEICSKTFKYLSLYERHQRTHRDDRAFKCEQCDKSFNRPDTLKTHMNIHTGAGYSCCGRFFHSKAALKYHTRTLHRVEVQKCRECPMTFESEVELKAHSETHKITEFPMLLDIVATEECSPNETNPDGTLVELQRKSLVFVVDEFVKKHSFSFWSDSGMRMSFLKM